MRAVANLCGSASPKDLSSQAQHLGINNPPSPHHDLPSLLSYDANVLHIILASGPPLVSTFSSLTLRRTDIECTRKWWNFPSSPSFALTVAMCENAFQHLLNKNQNQNKDNHHAPAKQ